MKFIGIIPARYSSTRFPGKPLALLNHKPVIQHVYEQVSAVLHETYVPLTISAFTTRSYLLAEKRL